MIPFFLKKGSLLCTTRNKMHQFNAGPRRGRHLRELQPGREAPGERFRGHNRPILGRRHPDALLHLQGAQELGAVHRVGAEQRQTGVRMQGRKDHCLGSIHGEADGQDDGRTQAVGHVVELGAVP